MARGPEGLRRWPGGLGRSLVWPAGCPTCSLSRPISGGMLTSSPDPLLSCARRRGRREAQALGRLWDSGPDLSSPPAPLPPPAVWLMGACPPGPGSPVSPHKAPSPMSSSPGGPLRVSSAWGQPPACSQWRLCYQPPGMRPLSSRARQPHPFLNPSHSSISFFPKNTL